MTTNRQNKGQYYCPKIRVISFSSEKGFADSGLKGQLQDPTDSSDSGTWE